MYNITLISTFHSESGRCNPNELYKILASINPDVIFDELPSHYFDMYYSDTFDMFCANSILLNRNPTILPIEVQCLKNYKKNHKIKILPIDIDVTSKLSKYQDEILFMFQTFFKYEDYIKLDNEKETLIAQEGFQYLNSDIFLDFLQRKEVLEKNIIESEIDKYRLLDIYKLFHAEQFDNRENEMLQNIYNYSKENQYNQAVFLLGCAHRKSIIEKIIECEKLSEIKLNWTIFGNE
jgi:hypothetical protein